MKILLVSLCFYPENFRVNDLCKELVNRGHTVTVLAGMPINRTTGKFWEGYGRKFHRVDNYCGAKVIRAYVTERHHDAVHLAVHYFSFWLFGNRAAKKLARQEDYDVVLVYQLSPILMCFPAMKVAKKQKIPLITYTLDLWPESAINAGGLRAKPIIRWLRGRCNKIYSACDKILISSKRFKENITEAGHPAGKIFFWPQYAEDCYKRLALPADDPIRKELPDGFKIVFTGNMGTSQSLETVVEAALLLRNYPDIHWVLIGDGRDKDKVEELAEAAGVLNNVHFTGRKPMEMMSAYLAACDAALLILKDDPLFNITLPAKVQSYMVCGIPILACVKGEGAKTVQEAECGICTEAVSGQSLAEAALKLYQMSPEERKTMGDNAILYSQKHFDKSILLDTLEKYMAE